MVIDIDAEESEWSPFNMRQYNLSILKPPVINKSGSTAPMSYADAAKSLDLLRQNLQRSINQEVKAVITKYIDMYIKPGVENIKNNLGIEAVTEDHINNLCRTILEESKRMYPVSAYSSTSPSLLCNINSNSSAIVDHNETSPENNLNNIQHHQLQLNHTVTSLSNSSATINLNDPVKTSNSSPITGIKRESDNDSMDTDNSRETGSVPPPNTNKKAKKSNKNAGKNTATNNNTGGGTSETSSNSSPQKSSKPIKKPTGPSRKHVTQWDATKLTPETYFIMGAKANKALGFAQTRGRLYIKHPGLFKYASDTDDKEWLSKNKLMPATGGRAYIMLLDDIMKLPPVLNTTINYDDIKGFLVPDFILYKMKSYINSWKKTYAEEAQIQRTSAASKNKSQAQTPPQIQIQQQQNNLQNNNNSMNLNHHQQLKQVPVSMGLSLSLGGVSNHQLPPPPPPPPPPPSLHTQQQQVQQQQIHQQNSHNQQQQGLNNYHIPVQGNPQSNVVMYEPNLMQPHEMTDMREYMHMDKPPPMYPGSHSTVAQLSTSHQQQQHNTLPHMPQMNPSGVYNQQLSLQTTSQSQLSNVDPFEQAIKGDWSGVSDRSLLLYALQSSRNISAWDPQDSFDLIESVTNGGGNLGDNSPLLQMPPDMSGTAPLGDSPANANELSAVLDQAFQYTET